MRCASSLFAKRNLDASALPWQARPSPPPVPTPPVLFNFRYFTLRRLRFLLEHDMVVSLLACLRNFAILVVALYLLVAFV
jgi:hypothetical protein